MASATAVPSGMLRTVVLILVAASAAAADLTEEMAAVEKIRQLKFTSAVAQKTISREQLRHYLLDQLQKELPVPIGRYLEALEALELIEDSDTALEGLLSLYDAQALAFYDPATHVYYALSDPPPGFELSGVLARALVMHELTHALQDQRFRAGEKLFGMRGNSDAQMAYQAVLEGEAMLVMSASLFEALGQDFDKTVREEAFVNAMAMMAELNQGIPSSAPPYFVEALKFPYLEGLRLVVEAYRRAGWSGVDALHKSPPASTEQVLHPEIFFAKKAHAAPVAVRPSQRKTLLTETMGEFSWKFLLGEEAASGWGGDSVQIALGSGGSLSVLVQSVWDTEADAEQFVRAYGEFLESRSIAAQLERDGRRATVRYESPGNFPRAKSLH